MRIIISPAKKMNVDTDSLAWRDLPAFLSKTERLAAILKAMDGVQLKKLWKCNDAITELNRQYRALSRRLGVRFADAGAWNIPLTFDGVHFTGEGHRLFGEKLTELINKGE